MARRGFIDEIWASYLHNQISGGDAGQARRALQEVCRLYRQGLRFKPGDTRITARSIETATLGRLSGGMDDSKLRRWCLNVIALVGDPGRSRGAVEDVIKRFHNDPDTMASAMAAHFHLRGGIEALSAKGVIAREQIVLAAHISGRGDRLTIPPATIDIEREEPAVLRTALVAVGLGRAPPHLFDPRYDNAELVGKLGGHDDHLVMQYSVWAVAEHPDLNVEHLGPDVAELEDLPANVRGWMYRAYGETDLNSAARHDVVILGRDELDVEARRQMARGLRDTYYDGLEEITSDWVFQEEDIEVRAAVLDHVVRQADRCEAYRPIAEGLFEDGLRRGVGTDRMLAAAAGRPIYSTFRTMEYRAEGDLFATALNAGNGIVVNMTTNNFMGNIQAGAMSVGGDARQEGSSSNTLTGDQAIQLRSNLSALASELRALSSPDQGLRDITAVVEAAADDPTPSRLARAKEALQALRSGVSDIAKLGGDTTKIYGLVHAALSAF